MLLYELSKKKATSVIRESTYNAVQYHATTVAKYDWSSGVLTLDTGGWSTATTKRRMNQFFDAIDLPVSVVQRDFEWYLLDEDGEVIKRFDGEKLEAKIQKS